MTKTVLIVEDNEKNRKLLRDILEYYGYSTLQSDNAEQGILLAKEHKPDLIILDIRLPGISGNEAMKLLKQDEETAKIPAMAVTASVMEEDKQAIMAAGFDSYHEKPIDRKKFMAKVKDLLGEGP